MRPLIVQAGYNPVHCPVCQRPAELVTGATIFPAHPDLAGRFFWICDTCGTRCGCHPGTTRALGVPATAETRKARMLLHAQRIDPLWKEAWRTYERPPATKKERAIIMRTARSRVYAFLAERLGITRETCHTAMFDLDGCRAAWRALKDVTYSDIRTWAKARKEAR